jgi:hypothetical protein
VKIPKRKKNKNEDFVSLEDNLEENKAKKENGQKENGQKEND